MKEITFTLQRGQGRKTGAKDSFFKLSSWREDCLLSFAVFLKILLCWLNWNRTCFLDCMRRTLNIPASRYKTVNWFDISRNCGVFLLVGYFSVLFVVRSCRLANTLMFFLQPCNFAFLLIPSFHHYCSQIVLLNCSGVCKNMHHAVCSDPVASFCTVVSLISPFAMIVPFLRTERIMKINFCKFNSLILLSTNCTVSLISF